MEATNSSFNVATFMLVGMGILIVISLFTLANYFFGLRSPLERNALGRMEAAVSPADVLQAHRQFRNQRFIFSLLGIFLLWMGLHSAAPEQTELATNSLFEAVSIALRALTDNTVALAQELGIGNECECADPARIGGNGP